MSKVLTEQELYDIEVAIYNDDNKALFKSLPEGIEDANDKGIVKELAKGQQYYIIPQSNIMLRQDGRLFNVKFIRAIKPMWTPNEFLVNIQGRQIRYSDIYSQQGWDFNHKKISRLYYNERWGISVTKAYKETFRDFIAQL